jgi:hypothetical protein
MPKNTAKTKIIEKIVTPAGTAKWAWLEKPDTSEYGKNRYKCALVLDKGDDAVEALVKKLRDLHKQHKGKADTSPVKDGDAMAEDDEKHEALRGKWLISAKSNRAPGLRNSDPKKKLAKAPRSGDLVKLAVAVASYDTGANKGVTMYLNAVQLLERREQDGADMFEDESSKFEPEAEDAEADKPAETEEADSDGDY